MCKISIIMPCYNHGKYVMDAISSVDKLGNSIDYEMIIINDGSTDEYTNTILKELQNKGYYVIFQENKGLSATRNMAISIAKGEYILPLDADNKLRVNYIYNAIKIFEENKDISIVYGNGEFFGEQTGVKRQFEFNLQRLMLYNFIDSCAVYRKTVWEAVGGYDSKMKYGLEDWEFWLNAAFKGFKFRYIDEILFDYRVLNTSMVNTLNASKIKNDKTLEYMCEKHKIFFGPQYIDDFMMSKVDTSFVGFIGKIILKKYFKNKYESMVKAGRLRKYL